MRDAAWWDAYYLGLAEHVSTASKDPSTKVGCVIVRPDKTIASVGYNGFARGVDDTDERLNHRPTKYAMIVHSEPNAIIAAREQLHGYTAYTFPFPPCAGCASLLVQAGVARVVAPQATDDQIIRWGDSFVMASTIFDEAGVALCLV